MTVCRSLICYYIFCFKGSLAFSKRFWAIWALIRDLEDVSMFCRGLAWLGLFGAFHCLFWGPGALCEGNNGRKPLGSLVGSIEKMMAWQLANGYSVISVDVSHVKATFHLCQTIDDVVIMNVRESVVEGSRPIDSWISFVMDNRLCGFHGQL